MSIHPSIYLYICIPIYIYIPELKQLVLEPRPSPGEPPGYTINTTLTIPTTAITIIITIAMTTTIIITITTNTTITTTTNTTITLPITTITNPTTTIPGTSTTNTTTTTIIITSTIKIFSFLGSKILGRGEKLKKIKMKKYFFFC